jgi:hypothetical protein
MSFADLKRNLKVFWVKNKRTLSFGIGLIGLLITALGIWELLVLFETLDEKYEFPLMSGVDYAAWFFVGFGGIAALFGLIYFYDYNKKHRRFEELIVTDSKAQFVRNLVEIEELAVALGPDYEGRVIEQRERYKVKTL